MFFDMYGPFQLKRENRKVISKQPEMWNSVRASCKKQGYAESELETAIGCYAFGIRRGDAMKPWYVGMTICKGGFRGETLQRHKRTHYNEALELSPGTPVLFLMPLLTDSGRFSRDRSLSRPLIGWVEKMLFGVALEENWRCRNQRDTKYLRDVRVRGIFNQSPAGPVPRSVKQARLMFGLDDD